MYSRWILCDFHAAQPKYIVAIASWGLRLVCQGKKGSPKLSINHWQAGLLVTCRCFKLTNSPCIFEHRTVTSLTTLVSKGRHCHWDFANRRLKDYELLLQGPESTQTYTCQTAAGRAGTINFVRRKFVYCDVTSGFCPKFVGRRLGPYVVRCGTPTLR